MKEVVNANIGSQVFAIDCDAYERLKDYLDDVRSRLSAGDVDTMDDIEARFAELFREALSSSMMVVTLSLVERTIARIGEPSDFGPQREGRRTTKRQSEYSETRRMIRRSRSNRSIAGVCGGLAEYFNFDATALRILMLLLILFGGLSIWVYVLMWIVIPNEQVK